MAKATRVKQLNFAMPNNVGLLMEITEALATAKINIDNRRVRLEELKRLHE